MKCYYEELGLSRDAGDGDIKTAYRKLALRWHPDKNPDCLEEAKERFQLIQQAYEVLSDAHERAWYDNHREQILRGKNSDYEENCLDLFQYFTVACYKGHGDDAKGFYAVYREVFAKLAAEDAEFMDDEEQLTDIPQFGDSQSSYDEVVGPFYAYWQAYCTKKTYTWLCPYDIQEIKDRRVLREIEKDLKKLAQKAKKERNEEVRNLVSFVRKRDKRVQEYRRLLEERAAINRQKQEQNRLEQIRRRQREVAEMRQNSNHLQSEGYEEQLKHLEEQYGADSSDCDDEEERSEEAEESETEVDFVDDLYCVACNRAFTNERAFANHESSKKHRENVERMRQEMHEEEAAFKDTEEPDVSAEEEEEAEEIKENGADTENELIEQAEELSMNEEIDSSAAAAKKNRKSKKSKKANKANVSMLAHASDHEDSTPEDHIAQTKSPANSDTEDDWNSSNKKAAKKSKNKKQTKKPALDATAPVANAKETPIPTTPATTQPLLIDTDCATTATHTCVTCKASFDSKNKLFAHLKKTNHGVYIPKQKTETAEIQPKKAKGKRK